MNRTVKITGFSLQRGIRQKLGDLTGRVAQVEKAYLSADRNAAFVRLTSRESVQFVLEQRWELQNEQLRVRCADPLSHTPPATCVSRETNCQSSIPGRGRLTEVTENAQDSTATWPGISKEEYNKGCSRFWADVPHQNVPLAGRTKRKKRRKNIEGISFVRGPEKKCHKPKRRRKKKNAYLESAPSLPFGIECCARPDDSQGHPESSHTVSDKLIFIKGSQISAASVPLSSTASAICELVADVAKVPSELLNITVEGRSLTDEIAHNMGVDATVHYSVKGMGGADSEQKGKDRKEEQEAASTDSNPMELNPSGAAGGTSAQLSKSAHKKQRRREAKLAESTSSISSCSSLRDLNMEGDTEFSDCTSSASAADPSSHEIIQEDPASTEPMAVTISQESVAKETDDGNPTCLAASPRKENTPDSSVPRKTWVLSKNATESEVQDWLLRVCIVSPDSLPKFDGMDGKTMYSYPDFESLLDDVEISYGKARTILFYRDSPNQESELLQWSVDEVIAFVRAKLGKPDLDLQSFHEKEVDGVVFLSFADGGELKRDLGLNGVIARRIFEERNAILTEKETKALKTLEADISSLNAPVALADERTQENQDRENEDQLPQTSEPKKIILNKTNPVLLEKENSFTVYQLFLQNKLQLQPVTAPANTEKLKQCELKVLFHKRKDLNKLEEQFQFFMLCEPEFCYGRSAKGAYTKLWKMLKEEVSTKWSELLPTDIRKMFTFEAGSDRVQYDHKIVSFGDENAKILPITEFHKTVRRLDQFSTHVMVVDTQLLEKECLGYCFKLKVDKSVQTFRFGFNKNFLYWFFDSSDFGWGFQERNVQVSKAGSLSRCQYHTDEQSLNPSVFAERFTDELVNKDAQDFDRSCWSEQIDHADDAKETAGDLFSSENDEGFQEERFQEQVESFNTPEEPEDQMTTETRNEQFLVPEVDGLTFIVPRPFKTNNWKYWEGILRLIECGDYMLFPAVEFKLQASCPDPNSPEAMRSFLYKSLEFVCGCLNARKNGTIYFGIAESPTKKQSYKYGDIVGIEMDQRLCAHYYDKFHSVFLKACFPDHFEIIKLCISGPHFIHIGNTNSRYVIEVDIEPNFQQTQNSVFKFYPKPIYDKYGQPPKKEQGEKHVYLKNHDKWTGIFRRDGSETKYVDKNQKQVFECSVLPDLCTKRQQEENREKQTKSQLLRSSQAETLKCFMEECDTSMFPILVLPKLSELEQAKIEYFGFVYHIRWSAVFDFDNDSEKKGIYGATRNTNLAFEVHESVVFDFEDLSIEDRKDHISFPKKAVWLFANGKSAGSNAFDRLQRKAWRNSYWTYIQNAVAFYKDNSVIPPSRRLSLILISDEMDDGIIEASQDIKTAFGWKSILFVFNSLSAREHFASELSDDVFEHSVVMPWQHVHFVVCQCLKLKDQDKNKFVCTSSDAAVPIPPSEWQSWNDLDILNTRECQEEWDSMSKSRCDKKAQEEEQKFYQGKPVSWWNFFLTGFSYNQVMERSDLPKLLKYIDDKIKSTDKEIDRVPIVTLSHMNGAGGTTLGKNVLWNLKDYYKCAILKKISKDTERQVTQFWESVEGGQDQLILKPVVLLSDNLTNGDSPFDEFELCRRLYRRQKELQLARPLAVLIHCHRNMKPEGKFKLPQKLTEKEKTWMERKSLELEKQHVEGVETFIAFLSMRHEFDQDFLQNTITQFLDRKFLDENERLLIEYVALITSYFPLSKGSPGLPVTSCDALMRRYDDDIAKKLPWEKTLSKVAKILLTVEYRYESDSPGKIVRIACQPYAKVILKTVLEQNNEKLGCIVLRCLNSPLLSNLSPSCKEVVEILSKMLIERHFDEDTTQMTHMSPLIMDIRGKDFEIAVKILQEGYKKLKNEVFNQQLARLYMSQNQLDKATEFAQLAVELSPEKSDFKHTLGLVHLKRFSALVASAQQSCEVNATMNIEHLKVAFLALTSFIGAQGNVDEALSICYAFCQTIEVVNKVLQYLLNLIPEEEKRQLGKYLTEDDYLGYPLFNDLEDQERIALKGLLMHGIKALRFLFYLAYSHSFGRNGVSYQVTRDFRTMENVTNTCIHQMRLLATNVGKLRIQMQFVSQYENRPKEDNARRFRNVKLKGCFFESIFYQFKDLRGTGRKRRETTESLLEIERNLDAIKDKSFTDMDNFMSVSLAIQVANEGRTFTDKRSQIYKMCDKLIRSDLEPNDTRRMRAHLYRVLVSWPHKYWEGFNEDEFKRSFQQRSALLMHKKEPLSPKVHFFVTNETQDFYLCHWTDIYGDVEREAPWAEMRKLLKSFTGEYKVKKKPDGEQFSSIEMDWRTANGELRLTIWKIRGIKVFRQERVEFYLGFCLQGPVAFIHNVLPNASDT